jgi:hypothetical protein
MFAEIRGFGAGLPQDANAQRLCDLWNVAQSAPAGSHGLKESWDVWNMTGPQSTQWDELEDSDRARWAKAIAASAPAGWEDWEVAAFNEGVDTAVEYVDSSGLIGNDFRRQIVIEIGALKRTAPKPAQEPSR